jgi:hypothetical protein
MKTRSGNIYSKILPTTAERDSVTSPTNAESDRVTLRTNAECNRVADTICTISSLVSSILGLLSKLQYCSPSSLDKSSPGLQEDFESLEMLHERLRRGKHVKRQESAFIESSLVNEDSSNLGISLTPTNLSSNSTAPLSTGLLAIFQDKIKDVDEVETKLSTYERSVGDDQEPPSPLAVSQVSWLVERFEDILVSNPALAGGMEEAGVRRTCE